MMTWCKGARTACVAAMVLSLWPGLAQAGNPGDPYAAGIHPANPVQEGFYSVAPAELPGRAGTLIRAEPVAPPPGASVAYRIIYRSRSDAGRPVAVSGVIAAGPQESPSPRPVVSWGHGTTGIAPDCAPSLMPQHDFRSISGLQQLLADGYVVVATDYQGLGEGSVHPYLDGRSSAHAMIDAVRAARALPGLHAGSRYATWGFSEGGQASLFAGQVARSYAPELRLEGVAAVSAPTQLRRLLASDIGTPAGDVVASFAAWSWSRSYGLPLGEVVRPEAAPTVARIATLCSIGLPERLALGLAALTYGQTGFLQPGAAHRADWGRVIAMNSAQPRRGVPVFLAQGEGDALVAPAATRDFARQLCRDGVKLDYREVPFASHGDAATASAGAATDWLAARLSGARPISDCATLAARERSR